MLLMLDIVLETFSAQRKALLDTSSENGGFSDGFTVYGEAVVDKNGLYG